MDIYANYVKLRDEKGLKDADVVRCTGIAKSTLSEWKRGKSTPKHDKLEKIAACLGVSVDYLKTGVEPAYSYFLDPEVAEIAQDLHDNEDLRIIFDATRKASKEDLQFIKDFVQRMKIND